MRENYIESFGLMEPEQDLVAVGWIALRGTSVLAAEGEEELQKRFSNQFVKRCQNIYEFRGLMKVPGISDFEAETGYQRELGEFLERLGASSWCMAGEGGVMAALWDYFDAFGLGFEIALRELPIRQETVEVCEVFDVNPYRLQSEGCLLLTAKNGGRVVRELEKHNIHAVVIGRTKRSIGREIANGEIRSFLDRPKPDELYRIQSAGGKK